MDYLPFRNAEPPFAVNWVLRSKVCNKNVAACRRLMHIGSTKADMKYSEFRRWLRGQGATFVAAKGSHFKVYLGNRQTIFPDHGAKEISEGLRRKILKDLGLKS